MPGSSASSESGMTEELERARVREAATREILELISSNRDDDRPVFEAILRRATQLCGAHAAALVMGRRGDTHQRMVASDGVDPHTIALYDSGEVPMNPEISFAAQAILTCKVVHVEDMMDTDRYRRGEGLVFSTGLDSDIHTIVYVPLVAAAGGIGSLNIFRRDVRPYTADEIALVEGFAAQAVIAIENVRQFRELEMRLARERASAEILELISRSRDDERPVFEAILHRVADLCGAHSASLIMGKAGDQNQQLVAHLGADPATVALSDRGEVPMDPEVSSSAQAILSGKVIHIADLMETDSYRRGVPLVVSVVRNAGMRTIMWVPLVTAAGGIGAFSIYRKELCPFTADEIALVETFAAQAVIAIENVRQFRELQERLKREAATREILEVISHSRDDDGPVFDVVLRKAADLCAASMASLNIVDDDRSQVIKMAEWGDQNSDHLPVGTTIWQIESGNAPAICVREGRIVQLRDMADTDLYRSGDVQRVAAVQKLGIRTFLAVPLFSGSKAIGCISVYRHEVKPFTADENALLETFAAQAVIAIENAQQVKAVDALNAELGDRVEAQVGEIERMGRLKRFLPPAVADAVVTSGSEKMLSSHRALLGVLFCDIRGFTAFCETAEPEETIEVLQTYHEEMGKLINGHGAGVDHRMGDGIMVLFNDPLPCDDPAGEAVRLAIAMRSRMGELCLRWKRIGYKLGFGVGVSLGYATVGMVGFEGRFDYTASGTAINLASRLCDEAQDGEILLSPRAAIAVEDRFPVEPRGDFTLKGMREPVEVFRLIT
jgi:class 3 adenylate cyclase